ncbi:hypothetical protein [Desulfobulbus oligotrophicus]|jgi:hypothetical protein|uniref:Uncharacterized protein n=1 Tax=Desulfobulbus oligotrophicus TaxID=1909699 RepID=A0A7T5VC57_9BACT|nr:hypothetical protein [Desulfobulbus oligotrophicus]MDY0390354.1 hypothetical protein [Desulfobulbus oligotrophicus]QQG65170.1 hypothetical protein HP555_04440 [Desulfobulbus oligotrophicus]
MTSEQQDVEAVREQIAAVLTAAQQNDVDALYEHRAAVIAMYAQAMVEFHFEESQLPWLNDLLAAVQMDDSGSCRRLLAQQEDVDTVFLATQFASVIAGFFHHDECSTVLQAIGLQALLDEMDGMPGNQ